MRYIPIINGPQHASSIILGCMRMPALNVRDAAGMIRAAWEEGVNFFDHATCYGDGEAEACGGVADAEKLEDGKESKGQCEDEHYGRLRARERAQTQAKEAWAPPWEAERPAAGRTFPKETFTGFKIGGTLLFLQ